jgi:hypothetical protein
MPCRDSRDDNLGSELNHVTKLLCEACARLDSAGLGTSVSKELACWWQDHQAADRARIKAEQEYIAWQNEQAKLKRQALDKLSEAEKKALGVR